MSRNFAFQRIFFSLFMVPFAGVGIVMAGWIVSDLLAWRSAQSWVATPALLSALEIKEHTGSDSSSTREVNASYSYRYDGNAYTGTRVGISDGADNIGSYHQRVYDRLRAARDRGELVCYVNPAKPAEALLDRELRVPMLLFKGVFVLAFGGIGFGVVFALWRKAGAATASAATPAAPWRAKPEWNAGVIRAGGGGAMGLWLFAGLWNLMAWPIAFVVFPQTYAEKGNEALLILIFPAVGILVAIGALVSFLGRRKFGVSELRLAATPAVLGGALRGVVRLPRMFDAPSGFDLTVSCKERTVEYRQSNGKRERHVKINVLWQDRQKFVNPIAAGAGCDVPVIFALPYDARASEPGGDHSIDWELDVSAKLPGLDYSASFQFPAYRTEASRADFALSAQEQALMDNPADDAREFADARVYFDDAADGALRLYFPAPRHFGMAVFSSIFAAVFGGVGYGITFSDAPSFFPLIFGGVGAIFVICSLFLWLAAWRVEVRGGVITVRSGFFAMIRTRTVNAADIEAIDATSNTEYGGIKLYDIAVKTKDGKKIVLCKRFDGQRTAQKIIDKITAAL